MAEAIVCAIMEQLVLILRQQTEEGIRLIVGADREVQNLNSNFLAIQAVLEDAESKQVKEKAVRDWLEKLKDVSYDIDDVLDEWNSAIQQLRIKEVENASKPLRKVCSAGSYFLSCCSRNVFRYDIAVKIKNLNRSLDVVSMEKDRFQFSPTDGTQKLERQITTSMVEISEVYGRDHDKNEVVNLLLAESSPGPTIPIISMVGMGGIGKTTLARLAFNDNKVKAYFHKKIWVCVSEPFNELRIAKAILESFMNVAPNLVELEPVLQNIRQYVERKKFLLIFDDVWTENPDDWVQIKNSLMCGFPGSKILVTTRKDNVANVIGTTHMIRIGTLPEKDCWSLFNQLAFFGRTVKECEELKHIGAKIVKRCKGLPLAIKTLGSLLRFKRETKEWQSILDSKMWEVEEVEKGLFPPLLLSYYDLPSMLKKCFLYCAIFPKDYNIQKHELIFLWMAQDYLKINSGEDVEGVGEKYFEILAMRSFFQEFERYDVDGSIISCKMHDIVHDFAQFLTKDECFTIEVDDSRKSFSESYNKARHSMIIPKKETSFPISICTAKKLRSLVVEDGYHCTYDKDLCKIFDQLTCLRTLDLKDNLIKELPKGIEKLKHLRYLNLYRSKNIKELPETLCELYNLRILNVRYCDTLQKLPQGIGKLINLSHLHHDDTSISYMPKGVERLTCLQRLYDFVVSNDGHGNRTCKLGCLNNFNHLKSLGIKGLGNLVDVGDLRRAQLNKKKNLLHLFVYFDGMMNEDHDVVLQAAQPPSQLERLTIEKYRGMTFFPNWLMSLTKLRYVILDSFMNCQHLPPLGRLPSLESLHIENMQSIRRVGNEFLGIETDMGTSSSSSSSVIVFPELKSLEFGRMDKWEEWDYRITGEQDVKIMPCLRSLIFFKCPKLKSMPRHLLPLTMSNNCGFYQCPLLKEYVDNI
ncbi:Disease resistance protein [Melia azedarach]|uniref:Disease resistance protein n=1 Tax=Melia azedarach TaxID=155640 RepID=A0ACC1Y5Y1_MELAZ|nr:Disease resistance protein [Melia azedarach]